MLLAFQLRLGVAALIRQQACSVPRITPLEHIVALHLMAVPLVVQLIMTELTASSWAVVWPDSSQHGGGEKVGLASQAQVCLLCLLLVHHLLQLHHPPHLH